MKSDPLNWLLVCSKTKISAYVFAGVVFFSSSYSAPTLSAGRLWITGGWGSTVAATAIESCMKFYDVQTTPGSQYGMWSYTNAEVSKYDTQQLSCSATETWAPNGEVTNRAPGTYTTWVYRQPSCAADSTDLDTGVCVVPGTSGRNKGAPSPEQVCSLVGNPINVMGGNKFQQEIDYKANGVVFSRYYNSTDGVWRHSFSAHLISQGANTFVILSDGRQIDYTTSSSGFVAKYGEVGKLDQSATGWHYVSSDNTVYTFDSLGRLVSKDEPSGRLFEITYPESNPVNNSGSELNIVVNGAKHYTLIEDFFHQPIKFYDGQVTLDYLYDSNSQLTEFKTTVGGISSTRQYQYSDPNDVKLLTGIVDERGVLIAKWSYDSSGRAISSEHAGVSDKVMLTYIGNTLAVAENSLSKKTTYTFQYAISSPRISSIAGEASANCLASNSSYTYDDSGRIISKTDALNSVTTYTYNDRGLEVSRVEASGTPLARTTTTEWDPSRFLKTKVVEPTRTTLYTYDAQGRPLSQQTTSN
ncbi:MULTISPECIES: DUF6531 domain-containing protein [Pseudomonas]|uniref:DUF6531 domain-containing protein n=1 Tax=Pseudomonas TaxID=286 RepID=UPI000E00D89C|nr:MULTISPECIES: DUF6531 domain-containing protein [Pseudomonas]RBH52328.1 RHS repeat protein [Pseudomonas sp. MWU13-2860]